MKKIAIPALALCLSLSAAYELVEWAAALGLGARADDFLAIQGDSFDAQSDMALALAGGAAGLALFSRIHDRQLLRMAKAAGRSISPVRQLPGFDRNSRATR